MRLCSIEGCESRHFSLGYCRSHWRRLKVYGDPLGLPEPRPPWEHGTVTGYKNHHCRCDACRAAGVGYDVKRKKGSCPRCGGPTSSKYVVTHCLACRRELRPEAQHGTEARYKRCRCDECRSAAAAARRRRRARVA